MNLMKKALEEKMNELKKLPYEELLRRTNSEPCQEPKQGEAKRSVPNAYQRL